MIGRYAARLSLILVLIGFVGAFEAFGNLREDKAFLNHGLTAIAEPAGPVVKGQSYQGDLVFLTKTGETVTIRATKVPLSIREGFRVEKNVQIKYLPEKPTTARFSDWARSDPKKDLAQAGLLFVVGLLAFWILRRSRD